MLRFIGVSLLETDGPAFGLSIPFGTNGLNAIGAFHGGALATALDVAGYLAVLPDLEPNEEAITHAFSASYLAAAGKHDLRATGTVLRRTRRLAFVLAEVRSQDDLVATATITKSVLS